MSLDLVDTTAAEVAASLARLRRRSGSAALGMVLTLVIATEERDAYDAQRAAMEASTEHPSRIVSVIARPGRGPARLDAEIRLGPEAAAGEMVTLRLHGDLADHADSVVMPLLLPDTPVVAWWPGTTPPVPAESAIGALAQRRITDAAAAGRPGAALASRVSSYRPGDTDLAWTRLTPWRALLAAALDLPFEPIASATVSAARGNPSAVLLASWLECRLDVPVTLRTSRGPGITAVRLATRAGDIAITRPDGQRATFVRPGEPERMVALARRTTQDLLAEELRRLDADEPYAETLGACGPLLAGSPTGRDR